MEQPAQQHLCPVHNTPTRTQVGRGGLELIYHICDQCLEEFDLFASCSEPPKCSVHPDEELTSITTHHLLENGNIHTEMDLSVCKKCHALTLYEELGEGDS